MVGCAFAAAERRTRVMKVRTAELYIRWAKRVLNIAYRRVAEESGTRWVALTIKTN